MEIQLKSVLAINEYTIEAQLNLIALLGHIHSSPFGLFTMRIMLQNRVSNTLQTLAT